MHIIAPPNIKEFLEKRVESLADKVGDMPELFLISTE